MRVRRRLLELLGLATALALVAPGSAAAAASLSITTGADPTESITTQLGATGNADTSESIVDLTVKPAGGAGCGANPGADSGSTVLSMSKNSSGTYTYASNWTFDDAGSYVLCAWLRDYTGCCTYPVVATATKTIAVRIPKLSLALSAPASVASGAVFQASLTAQAETERTAYAGAVPDTGRGCAANWSALTQVAGYVHIDDIRITGGPTIDTQNVTITGSGVYLLCGYFQRSSSDTAPEATATGAIMVNAPCVVPALAENTTLAAMKSMLATAHCAVGKVGYTASSRVRRGNVISINPKPGVTLRPLAPVNIVVSAGAPCIVPAAAGKTLRAAKAALVRSHCTVGRVTRRHSRRYRRGRVITLSAPRHARLSPRAKVGIVVSSGRGAG